MFVAGYVTIGVFAAFMAAYHTTDFILTVSSDIVLYGLSIIGL